MSNTYLKELTKWAKKTGLKDVKMPKVRKREIAKQMGFAIAAKHKGQGVSTESKVE